MINIASLPVFGSLGSAPRRLASPLFWLGLVVWAYLPLLSQDALYTRSAEAWLPYNYSRGVAMCHVAMCGVLRVI